MQSFKLSSVFSYFPSGCFPTLDLGDPNIICTFGNTCHNSISCQFKQVCRVNSGHDSSQCQTGVLHRMRAWTDTQFTGCVSSRRRKLFSDGVRRGTCVFVLELETRRAGRLPRDFSNPLMYLNDSGEVYRGQRMLTIPPPSISCVKQTHAESVSQSSDCRKQLSVNKLFKLCT